MLLALLGGCGAPSARTATTAVPIASAPPSEASTPPRSLESTSSARVEAAASTAAPSESPSSSVEPPPLAAPARPPERVRATLLVEGRFAPRGLPAISPDGRSIVWLERGGDGLDGRDSLVTLDARTGRLERRDPLAESRASEEDEAAAARHRESERRIARAQRYLERRTFLSLPRLEELSEADEPLALEERGGTVEILDAASRSRFRRELVAPAPRRPDGLTGDELDAWEVEHHCDEHLLEASAWRIDATHLLLVVRIGATPDECWEQDEAVLVTLSP